MTREFKVGDKVFDLRFGNGEVVNIWPENSYPIIVRFGDSEIEFNLTGKYLSSDINPTLFHGQDLIIEVKEPEYEWQALAKDRHGKYFISPRFYQCKEHATAESIICDFEFIELFEPSKRLVKRG